MRSIIIALCLLLIYSCNEDNKKTVLSQKDSVANSSAIVKMETGNKTGYDTLYFEDGSKKLGGMLVKGKREGIWTSWYPDGTMWSEGEFKNGKPSGKTVTYYETGNKRYEGFYMEGKKAGKWFFWDENGKLVNEQDFTK